MIEAVDVTQHPDFSNHERIMRCEDSASGLLAYIAIHNLNRGPALGGCRIWPYASEAEALTDVMRLSKGMTYKSAIANLPLGGGKAVIYANPKTDKTRELLLAMGDFVDSFSGDYITAEDSGTTVEDLKIMSTRTSHLAGIVNKHLQDGTEVTGDPSPSTAYGVFVGIKSSLQYRFNSTNLNGVKVAVQGVGNVGRNLVKLLSDAGAKVFVSDAYEPALAFVREMEGVSVVSNDEIQKLKVDVYSPCALGNALNMTSLVEMQAPIVAGAANNQLATKDAGDYLFHKGIVYAPDYVINAGGIIDIFYETNNCYDHKKVIKHIDGISDTLTEIFNMSEEHQASTQLMADLIAENRFLASKIGAVA